MENSLNFPYEPKFCYDVDRYNAVCRPHYFHYRTVVSHGLTNLTSYVLPVVILSTLLNIPKFFETEFVSFKLHILKYEGRKRLKD